MENKPYVQFAREHHSQELKLRAEAKKERLQREAVKATVPEMATK